MNIPQNKYLFNFSSSYSGGGLKILKSYLDFFDEKGGAYFILNEKLESAFKDKYKNLKIYFVNISKVKRLFDDMYYLKSIISDLPNLDLYFSYGIPVYKRIAKKNWFHVSNMIPIQPKMNYLGAFHMMQMKLLGHRIKVNASNADFLSADSQDAVNKSSQFLNHIIPKEVVLKNGIDGSFLSLKNTPKNKNAVTIGTQHYKDIRRLYNFFIQLRSKGEVENLVIIGDKGTVPSEVKLDPNVILLGLISPEEVLNELAKSQTYISTSQIENSSVAALEGLYLCSNSYLSTIGPHREMLEDASIDINICSYDELGEFFKVTDEVPTSYVNSISWNSVNLKFLDYLKENIN